MATIKLSKREACDGLPQVCIVCGNRATMVRTKNLSWCPSWVLLFFFCGFWPGLILALIMLKTATIHAPLCANHRHHWTLRTLVYALGPLALVGQALFIVLETKFRPGADWLWIIFFVCLFSWLVTALVLIRTTVSLEAVTEDEIILRGVSPLFVHAVLGNDSDESRERYRIPPGYRFVEFSAANEITNIEDTNIQVGLPNRNSRDESIRE